MVETDADFASACPQCAPPLEAEFIMCPSCGYSVVSSCPRLPQDAFPGMEVSAPNCRYDLLKRESNARRLKGPSPRPPYWCIVQPPPAYRSCPVSQCDCSEARNTITSATSSGRPTRRIGIRAAMEAASNGVR